MKTKPLAFAIAIAVALALSMFVEPALAGPGGKIASAIAGTFWGKMALLGLFILFLPLIIYAWAVESIAEKRARRDLRFMSSHAKLFDWLNIQQRAKECFLRVHSAWQEEAMAQAADWMTDWYWQNQQLAHLDKWRREGLANVCDVKKIGTIKPLLFVHRNYGQEHEGSIVVLSITAYMKDYLERRSDRKLVEGDKTYKDVETIWSFTLENGVWKVSDIEEAGMSVRYAKMAKELPKIESTLLRNFSV